MAHLIRSALAAFVIAAMVAGCSDGAEEAVPDDEPVPSVTTSTVDLGGLPLDVPVGYQPIPLPSLGFALAVPERWQVALLTDDALEQLEDTAAVSRGFIDAARNAQASSAILYAAQPERVADLKVQRLPARPLDDVAAEALAAAPVGAELEIAGGRARIDFTTSGGGVSAAGSQWLIPGPDGIWSLIITSEDAAGHDALATAIADTLVFD